MSVLTAAGTAGVSRGARSLMMQTEVSAMQPARRWRPTAPCRSAVTEGGQPLASARMWRQHVPAQPRRQQERGQRQRSLRASSSSSSFDPEVLTNREVPLTRLQQLMDDAIDAEDYDAAAQLRDEIQRRRFDNRLAVEEANDKFYAAFTSGSLPAMADIWGKGEHVQCIHPGAGCIAGRDSVLESWKLVLGSGRLRIKLQDVRVYAGENDGFVTCVEVVEAAESRGRVVATNVFEKQNGKWKITHHHGSPCPPMI